MKLSFASRKDSKNCLYFVKALQHLGKHCPKDEEKKMYLSVSRDEVKIANSLRDMHHQEISQYCMLTIKKDLYTLTFSDPGINELVYELEGFKLIKCFAKNEHRVVLIELVSTEKGLTLFYETEGDEI